MAKHVSLFHRRDDAVENVEVGTAYRARRDLDNRVARMLDTRIVNRSQRISPLPCQQSAFVISPRPKVRIRRGDGPELRRIKRITVKALLRDLRGNLQLSTQL